ncbi:hypothetical protein HDU89_004133 [Geranomyces variabilis]|nr:hypothetical protein HDU89_004133 [Geranomyces variabilis]
MPKTPPRRQGGLHCLPSPPGSGRRSAPYPVEVSTSSSGTGSKPSDSRLPRTVGISNATDGTNEGTETTKRKLSNEEEATDSCEIRAKEEQVERRPLRTERREKRRLRKEKKEREREKAGLPEEQKPSSTSPTIAASKKRRPSSDGRASTTASGSTIAKKPASSTTTSGSTIAKKTGSSTTAAGSTSKKPASSTIASGFTIARRTASNTTAAGPTTAKKPASTRKSSKEKWILQTEEGPDYARWATTLPLPDGEDPEDWKVLPFSDSHGNRKFIADIVSEAGIVVYVFESGIFKNCFVTSESRLQGDLKGKAVDVMIWGNHPWHTDGAMIMLNKTGKWTAFTFKRLLEDLRQIAPSRQDKGTLMVAFRDLAPFEHDPPVDGDGDGDEDGDNGDGGGNGDDNGDEDGDNEDGGNNGNGNADVDTTDSEADTDSQYASDTIPSVSSSADTEASDVVDNIIAPERCGAKGAAVGSYGSNGGCPLPAVVFTMGVHARKAAKALYAGPTGHMIHSSASWYSRKAGLIHFEDLVTVFELARGPATVEAEKRLDVYRQRRCKRKSFRKYGVCRRTKRAMAKKVKRQSVQIIEQREAALTSAFVRLTGLGAQEWLTAVFRRADYVPVQAVFKLMTMLTVFDRMSVDLPGWHRLLSGMDYRSRWLKLKTFRKRYCLTNGQLDRAKLQQMQVDILEPL